MNFMGWGAGDHREKFSHLIIIMLIIRAIKSSKVNHFLIKGFKGNFSDFFPPSMWNDEILRIFIWIRISKHDIEERKKLHFSRADLGLILSSLILRIVVRGKVFSPFSRSHSEFHSFLCFSVSISWLFEKIRLVEFFFFSKGLVLRKRDRHRIGFSDFTV